MFTAQCVRARRIHRWMRYYYKINAACVFISWTTLMMMLMTTIRVYRIGWVWISMLLMFSPLRSSELFGIQNLFGSEPFLSTFHSKQWFLLTISQSEIYAVSIYICPNIRDFSSGSLGVAVLLLYNSNARIHNRCFCNNIPHNSLLRSAYTLLLLYDTEYSSKTIVRFDKMLLSLYANGRNTIRIHELNSNRFRVCN